MRNVMVPRSKNYLEKRPNEMRMLPLKTFDPIMLNLRSARIFFTGHKIPLHYLSDTSATYVYIRRPVPSTDQAIPSCFYFRIL